MNEAEEYLIKQSMTPRFSAALSRNRDSSVSTLRAGGSTRSLLSEKPAPFVRPAGGGLTDAERKILEGSTSRFKG